MKYFRQLLFTLLLSVATLSSITSLVHGQQAQSSQWAMWGADLSNTHFNPSETIITPENVGKLVFKWAFAFPDTAVASSQPAVVDGVVYVGSWNGRVYAIDAKTGEQKWMFFTGVTGNIGVVRVGVTVTDSFVLFGDQKGRFYALNKENGTLAWINNKFETHPLAQITGSPVVYKDRVYVPMASREESAAADPNYTCCTFRGSLTALNLSDGSVAWRYFTVAEPEKSEDGKTLGPSGIGVWSTPAIDPDGSLIYITTGNNYTPPVSPTSDAIIAINLEDGTEKWVKQLVPNDWWNNGCDNSPKVNCDDSHGDDYDFSSSPMIVQTKTQKIVVGIQKNGSIVALNAADGDLVWTQYIGAAVAINWGTAWDGSHIYAGDASFSRNGRLYAIDPDKGKMAWKAPMPSCKPGKDVPLYKCWAGNMNSVSASPGLVWVAAMDGQIHAFDSQTGKALWSFNTARSYQTVNGVGGNGGSIAAAGVTVAEGQVFVTSGYSPWFTGMMEGNVLVAFGLPEQMTF
jgi:polyvinyl alcohol dehydrogenase (cytochrome)